MQFLKRYKRFVVENKTNLFFSDALSNIEIDSIEDLKLAEALLKSKISHLL